MATGNQRQPHAEPRFENEPSAANYDGEDLVTADLHQVKPALVRYHLPRSNSNGGYAKRSFATKEDITALRAELLASLAETESRLRMEISMEARKEISMEARKALDEEQQRQHEIQKETAAEKHANLEQEAEDHGAYHLSESMWDVSFTMGKFETWPDLVILCIGFGLNVMLQILFCVIVYDNMASEPPVTSDTLQGFADWRMVVGHDAQFYDVSTNTSLVTRICSQDPITIMATSQMDDYLHMQDYLDVLNVANGSIDVQGLVMSGPTLCALALVIWLLVLLGEVFNTFNFARAVMSLPIRGHTEIKSQDEEETLTLVSISYHRCVLLLLVTLVRLFVAGFLMYTGMIYLVYTLSLEDLMVNAIMLAFILDMDEFFYEKGAPSNSKLVNQRLQPIAIRKCLRSPLKQTDGRAGSVLLLTAVLISLFVWHFALPVTQSVLEGQRILCDGNHNFVYAVDKSTGIVTTAPTAENAMGNYQQMYSYQAVLQRSGLELTGALDEFQQPPAVIYDSSSIEKVIDMLSESRMASTDELQCEDMLDGSTSGMRRLQDFFQQYSTTVHWTLGNQGQQILTCGDLANYCGPENRTIRSLCPDTCQCEEPLRPWFDRRGCPGACWRALRTQATSRFGLMDRSGSDRDLLDEASLPSYQAYMEELQSYLATLGFFVFERACHGHACSESSPLVMQWGPKAIRRVALESWFEMAFNHSDTGVNFSTMAGNSAQIAIDAGRRDTCFFIRLLPKLVDFDPCKLDNRRTSTAREFGTLRGLCPHTCCVLSGCSGGYGQVRPVTSYPVSTDTNVTGYTFLQLQAWAGLDILYNAYAAGEDCRVYESFMCEFEMAWCSVAYGYQAPYLYSERCATTTTTMT